jgi:uncharacterized repeat protein (TIGR03803 family)
MNTKSLRFASTRLGAALLAGALTAIAQNPPTLKVLYTFRLTGTPGGIAEVSPGQFLGLVETGAGIFSITSDGIYNDLYDFPATPSGIGSIGLTPALNSRTYGAASNSGEPVVFSEIYALALGKQLNTYSFSGTPLRGATIAEVQSPDNHLYTFLGAVGATPIFSRLDYQGNATSMYTLSASQGNPWSMFLSTDGNFYGLSLVNDYTDVGIFRLTSEGSFSWVLPPFSAGTYGIAHGIALIQAGNGKFYGTLPQGGSANAGTIYEATLDGKMRTIHQFPQLDLGIPETLLEASDGMLYGTTRGLYLGGYTGYSSIFRLNPYTYEFTTIYSFKQQPQGECSCQVIQGSDGKLYGIASGGGTYGGGTVFVLDAGLPPPKPLVSLFAPQSGPVGRQILLWGRGLLGATSISFNGAAATAFKVASNQGIWVNVPAGATTGTISVTTPNGTYITTQSFTVN